MTSPWVRSGTKAATLTPAPDELAALMDSAASHSVGL